MKRKKLPYFIRLMRVSLKWTWRALVMIPKEMITSNNSVRKGKHSTGNIPVN